MLKKTINSLIWKMCFRFFLVIAVVGVIIYFSGGVSLVYKNNIWSTVLTGFLFFFTLAGISFSLLRSVKKDFETLNNNIDCFNRDDDSACVKDFSFKEIGRLNAYIKKTINNVRRAESRLTDCQVQIKDLHEEKKYFFSSAAYEIRTLLDAVMGFSDLLKETDIDEKQNDYLNTIRESGQILMILMNDVLDIARITDGSFSLVEDDFNLYNMLEDILEGLKAKASRRKSVIEIDYPESWPHCFYGDSVRIRQLLYNLIFCLVTFVDKGVVNLEVNGFLRDTGAEVKIRFSVSHTAIPAEDLEDVFDLLDKSRSVFTGKYTGVDMRLFVAKYLVEVLGGKLNFSTHGDNSFGVDLVFGINKVRGEESKIDTTKKHRGEIELEKLQGSLEKTSILVAEHSDINQKLFYEILSKAGAEFEIVSSAYEVIERVIVEEYDVLILDVEMPLMNGLASARVIRQELSKKMPIIGMYSRLYENDEKKAKDTGIDICVEKPVSGDELINTIREVLSKKKE